MSANRKISIKKVTRTLLTFGLVALCVVVMLSATKLQDSQRIRGFEVEVTNAEVVVFVTPASVKKLLLTDRHLDLNLLTVGSINLHQMENIAKANAWISDAQVYVDNDKKIKVKVTQRVPVVRIFDTQGNNYYLDNKMETVPVSPLYACYTPVVTGVPLLKNDSVARELKSKILYVVNTIQSDSFWRAQTAEIHFEPTGEFQLIPVVGQQRILLGDTALLTQKLTNVLTFYKKIMNEIGWDKYQIIDARFDKQIVASPALPWKPPVDKAIGNMNWVKSIIGKEVGETELSAAVTAPPTTSLNQAIGLVPSVPLSGKAPKGFTVSEIEPTPKRTSISQSKPNTAKTELNKPRVVHTKPIDNPPKAVEKKKQVKKEEPKTKKQPVSKPKEKEKKAEKRQPKYILEG